MYSISIHKNKDNLWETLLDDLEIYSDNDSIDNKEVYVSLNKLILIKCDWG